MLRSVAPVLLLALLALLLACSEGAGPAGTPAASPTPVPQESAPGHGLPVMRLDGVAYVPADGAPVPGSLEPVPGSEAAGSTVYRAAGGGAPPWLRYTREGASYRAWTPRPVRLAVEDLAGRLGIRPETVTVTAVEAVEWPNSCLGVEGIAIICAQVITPGFRITLAAGGTVYVYHSDRDQRVVPAEPRG